jgi:hypothetical protein
MDRVERSHRKTASGKCNTMSAPLILIIHPEKKLREHTEASVKRRQPGILQLANHYNNLCTQMQALIRQKKAPQGVIPPLPIARDGLFKLDVDDDIWQDVGLDDESTEALPGWLSDEKVRLGIRSLLEVERCEEEERRLETERCVMQEWFAEEWSRIQRVREAAGKLRIFFFTMSVQHIDLLSR